MRFVGPTASVFHSPASKSSVDTKVGSPPIVSRTSPLAKAASTLPPSAFRSAQAASENGLVMRGCSATRATDMAKSKVTSA